MKLTAFTDYSLRVLMYSAMEPTRRATIAEVVISYGVPENHLTKVVHFLGLLGWLATMRGKGGGMQLGMEAHRIVVGRVVRASEGESIPAECFGRDPHRCVISSVCRMRTALKEANDAFYTALDRYTLADLLVSRRDLAQNLLPQPQSPKEMRP
jgi:Rrf2 family transcriptional regulator, nitric oxide-sensitive transcriptional repressor